MATSVSGPLRLVTDVEATMVQVMVRAPRPRPHAGGMLVDFTTPATVAGGVVSFPCVPGPAVMLVVRAGVPQITVPLVVPDRAAATLEECMQAGDLADNATRSVLEDLARRIVEGVAVAEGAAQAATAQAETATEQAETATEQAGIATEQAGVATGAAQTATEQATIATGRATAAGESAQAAGVSEQAAKQSEQAATDKAGVATGAAQTATEQADAATEQAGIATQQAGIATTKAGEAAASATKAESEATRATNVVGSTRWDGDKLVVNGVTSPSLTGPQGIPGTPETGWVTLTPKSGITGTIRVARVGREVFLRLGGVATSANQSGSVIIADLPAGFSATHRTVADVPVSNSINTVYQVWAEGGSLRVALRKAPAPAVPWQATDALTGSMSWWTDDEQPPEAKIPGSQLVTVPWSGVTNKPDLALKADLVGGLVPTSQLPAVALTKPFQVAKRSDLSSLSAQEGDVAVITEGADRGTYMLGSGDKTLFSSWVPLVAPTDVVTSVNGQIGAVNLGASNVGAAPASHTHAVGDVTGLQAALDGKAASSHGHAVGDVTGLQAALDGKASTSDVGRRPALFSGAGTPPSTITGAVVGDWWLDTITKNLYKITGV